MTPAAATAVQERSLQLMLQPTAATLPSSISSALQPLEPLAQHWQRLLEAAAQRCDWPLIREIAVAAVAGSSCRSCACLSAQWELLYLRQLEAVAAPADVRLCFALRSVHSETHAAAATTAAAAAAAVEGQDVLVMLLARYDTTATPPSTKVLVGVVFAYCCVCDVHYTMPAVVHDFMLTRTARFL
jgi:hypothetical protein